MKDNVKYSLSKSPIGSNKKIRATLKGLGLTKVGKEMIRKDTCELRGMLSKVHHLVAVEEQ